MRDAFGGVFMFRLMLVFIFIYVAFTAISLKYAKSFRIKNAVIDFVEQNQITSIKSIEKKINKLDDILASADYNVDCKSIGYKEGTFTDKKSGDEGYCHNGAVIIKNKDKSTKDTIYYDIYTYADWDLGILNTIKKLGGDDRHESVGGRWRVSGEAIVVNK